MLYLQAVLTGKGYTYPVSRHVDFWRAGRERFREGVNYNSSEGETLKRSEMGENSRRM